MGVASEPVLLLLYVIFLLISAETMKDGNYPCLDEFNTQQLTLTEDGCSVPRGEEDAVLEFKIKEGTWRRHKENGRSDGTVRLVSSVPALLVGCSGFDACLGIFLFLTNLLGEEIFL